MNGRGKYLLAFLLFALASCEEEEPAEVSFYLKLTGFGMEQSETEDWPAFTHRLDGGVVYFVSEKEYLETDARDGIDGREFKAPPGNYGLVIKVADASLYGQNLAAYNVRTHFISITPTTDTIEVEVEPACALVRVSDPGKVLEEGPYMIERHSYAYGYFIPYPMTLDEVSGDYYAYFTPDPKVDDPSAFLWFYQGKPGPEEGGLATTGMEAGFQYRINIIR